MRYFAVEVNGPGIVKRLYGGKNAGRATEIVRSMKRDCGWDAPWPQAGSVGTVQAHNWNSAADKVFAEQIRRGILREEK